MSKFYKLLMLGVLSQISLLAFSTTSVSLLHGNFNDNSYVYDVKEKGKTTLTIDNYSANSYGDIYLFTDLTRANKKYKYQSKRYGWYYEVAPRIKLNILQNSYVQNTYLAFQYNKGEDYEAILSGVGVDLNIPYFKVLGLNIYRKKQNIGNNPTIQLTANYYVPLFEKFHFEGFTDKTKEDLLTQNQLLYAVSKDLFIGTEWHYYTQDSIKSSTFQYMIKYRW